VTITISTNKEWQARRDSNPQHPVLETGALAVRATGLYQQYNPAGLFCFFMWCVLAAKAAIFTELQLSRSCLFVLGGRVIPLFALCATKCDDVSHVSASFFMYPPVFKIN
jgi:hypothetical protein